MEIHIQKCQSCGSRSLRNILVREEGQYVYVQCRECNKLVGRYILSNCGYYHAGKEFESFLRSIERESDLESGKNIQALFEEVKTEVDKEFSDLKARLSERYGANLP